MELLLQAAMRSGEGIDNVNLGVPGRTVCRTFLLSEARDVHITPVNRKILACVYSLALVRPRHQALAPRTASMTVLSLIL
jgi:hypothetical protein